MLEEPGLIPGLQENDQSSCYSFFITDEQYLLTTYWWNPQIGIEETQLTKTWVVTCKMHAWNLNWPLLSLVPNTYHLGIADFKSPSSLRLGAMVVALKVCRAQPGGPRTCCCHSSARHSQQGLISLVYLLEGAWHNFYFDSHPFYSVMNMDILAICICWCLMLQLHFAENLILHLHISTSPSPFQERAENNILDRTRQVTL
jgi:hypothetical protein